MDGEKVSDTWFPVVRAPRKLLVGYESPRSESGKEWNMAIKTLYVGNIPYSSNDEELIQHFAEYGGKNPRIIEGRGFAFVDIDGEKLDDAITAKHNSELGGRRLTVNEARPRGEGGGGGGGSRSYSGGGGGGYGGGGGRDRSDYTAVGGGFGGGWRRLRRRWRRWQRPRRTRWPQQRSRRRRTRILKPQNDLAGSPAGGPARPFCGYG